MAANSLSNIVPQILEGALDTLREQAIMPRLVNRVYESSAGEFGSTIDIPVPAALTTTAVTGGLTHSEGDIQSVSPGLVSIEMDQWREVKVAMTDREMLEARGDALPMAIEEGVKSLANYIDSYILNLGKSFYGYVDPAGSELFSNISDVADARALLNAQLAPMENRRCVLSPQAEAQALSLEAFHNAQFGVGASAILEGRVERRLGADWFMDQNVPSFTAGASAGETDVAVDNVGGYAAGATTIHMDEATGNLELVEGDIISFAGHDQTYVVTAAFTGAQEHDVTIQPALTAAVADDEAVTIRPSGDLNMMFHRDAIAFVTRPLGRVATPGSEVFVQEDPISGLAIRGELSRANKRNILSLDVLFGAAVLRRDLGVRFGA